MWRSLTKRIRDWAYQGRPVRPLAGPSEPRIGVALAGGFARSLAHVGVLQVLEQNKIPIHCVAGMSSGAIIAGAGENVVVLGIRPTRPETGYGYIETGEQVAPGILRVRSFKEKPDGARAQEFAESGRHLWNSGMFVWSARTLTAALREHRPAIAARLEKIAAAWGTATFASVLRREYPQCENISIDYAVLEPRAAKGEAASKLYCIPADFGWNDLGSWASLYEHQVGAAGAGVNVIQAAGSFELDAAGNYVHAPGKFVAAVGVKDLVVVETEEALLVTTRDRAQDVGKIVKHLEEKKRKDLL